MPTVLVAGGGTGGHIFPGVAIARELQARLPGCEVIFVGTRKGLESRIVPAEGFRLITITSAGITGKRLWGRLKGLALVPLSLVQSWSLMGRTRPGLVVGVGGYASGPVLAAAVLRRVPTLIHEQNLIPGATNRWIAPWVTEVAVTFPETIERLEGRGQVLGNPVRREFTTIGPRPSDAADKHVLIFGGSRGARAINEAVCDALPALARLEGRIRVTHQTGDADLERVSQAYAAAGLRPPRFEVRPFISGMAEAVGSADLVVSRSGATTVAELTAAGRPSLLIPFAAAAHDHQTYNARKLVEAGASVMIEQKSLTGEKLAAEIEKLISSPRRLEHMSAASRALGRGDAAGRIAEVCVALLQEGGRN